MTGFMAVPTAMIFAPGVTISEDASSSGFTFWRPLITVPGSIVRTAGATTK